MNFPHVKKYFDIYACLLYIHMSRELSSFITLLVCQRLYHRFPLYTKYYSVTETWIWLLLFYSFYNISDSRILHVPITRFFSIFLSYSLFFYLVTVIYFDLLLSKMRQHLPCNLFFGLIGHFRLLKDVNISFFLSFINLQVFLFAWHYIKDAS